MALGAYRDNVSFAFPEGEILEQGIEVLLYGLGRLGFSVIWPRTATTEIISYYMEGLGEGVGGGGRESMEREGVGGGGSKEGKGDGCVIGGGSEERWVMLG